MVDFIFEKMFSYSKERKR